LETVQRETYSCLPPAFRRGLGGGRVRELALHLAELAEVEELLMGNSVRGLVRVRLDGETEQ